MANEVRFTGTLTYAKGTARASLSGSGSADVVGEHYVQSIQNIGAVEEQVTKGDIGTIGWAEFKNLDTVNFIRLGATTGVYTVKIDPGKAAGPMLWNSSTVYAIADDTGSPAGAELEYLLIEA